MWRTVKFTVVFTISISESLSRLFLRRLETLMVSDSDLLLLSRAEAPAWAWKSDDREEIAEEAKGDLDKLVLVEWLLSEPSRSSRPWTFDEDSIGDLDTIDATFELFDTPVVFDVPVGLISSEELPGDSTDEETRRVFLDWGWGLLARVKKSVIGFPWVVVAFFVFFAIIITKINGWNRRTS